MKSAPPQFVPAEGLTRDFPPASSSSSQQRPLADAKYRPDIDGLRALAVLSVIAFHAYPNRLTGGFVGVDVFFVISGFLISRILVGNLSRGTFSFTDFYARRIQRIFPALLLVLFASLAFGWFALLSDEFKQLGQHIAAGAGFVSNFVLWREAGYFDSSSETKPLLHLWSLGIEEQFYIVWPFLLWSVGKGRRKQLALMVVLAGASFCLNLRAVGSDASGAFYSPLTRFWELLSGGLLAWWSLYGKGAGIQATLGGRTRELSETASDLLSVIGLLLLAYSFWRIDANIRFPGIWALVPVLGTLMLLFAGPAAWINRKILANPIAVWIGLISFPLYLWHWPLLSFARIVENTTLSRHQRLVSVAISFPLAWLTYVLLERRVRFGRRGGGKIAILVALAVLVGFAGFLTYRRDGFVSRVKDYERIANAVNDWTYPNGLIPVHFAGSRVDVNSLNKPEVVLFGDSHIHQYGPRIRFLTDEGRARNIAVFVEQGCPPIRNVFNDDRPYCTDFVDRFFSYLRSQATIKTVLISACFNCYFIKYGMPSSSAVDMSHHYYHKKDGHIETFRGGRGRRLALQELSEMVRELSRRYAVYVLLDNPLGRDFDPKAILWRDGQRRPVYVSGMVIPSENRFALDPRQAALAREMKWQLTAAGAKVLEQADRICPGNLCDAFDSSGRPIYKDEDHMRPFFVLDRMNVIDEVITK